MTDDNIETVTLPPKPLINDNKPDGNVVPFKRVTPKVTDAPDEMVIKLFERYLASAKAGKIKFAAVATVDEDMVATTTWEPEWTTPQLISAALGAVNFLNHRFAASADGGGAFTEKYD